MFENPKASSVEESITTTGTGCCGEGTSGSTRFSTGTLPPNRELVSDGATFPVDGVTDVTGGGVDGRDGEEPNRS